MKRFIASVIVVVAFTFYAVFSRGSSSTATTTGVAASDATATGSQTAQTTQTTQSVAQSNASGYSDGTYTGTEANALYGVVQVQVVIQGGSITDAEILSHPTGRHSDQINAEAGPILVQEAIASQSASVQVVSGATLTSRAFMESLQSALDQA
jgi:uncharacterized protein with FMN-binding domain